MNAIIVISSSHKFKHLKKLLKPVVVSTFSILKKNNVAIDIFFVSDLRMRVLNKQWRGKDKTTNVLSFVEPKGFPHPEFKRRNTEYRIQNTGVKYLGEIYLAPDYILKHHEDIRFLLMHGILHLLGYTHDGKSDTMKMKRMEKRFTEQGITE